MSVLVTPLLINYNKSYKLISGVRFLLEDGTSLKMKQQIKMPSVKNWVYSNVTF